MPICQVRYKADRLTDDMLSRLGPALAESVARALYVPHNPNLRLTTADVEVQFTESSSYDTNIKDVGIMIFANNGPERQTNLTVRTGQIIDDLRAFLADYDRNLNLYVYVMLQNAQYMEI